MRLPSEAPPTPTNQKSPAESVTAATSCACTLPGHVPSLGVYPPWACSPLPVDAAHQPFFLFSCVLAPRLPTEPCARRSGLNVGVLKRKGLLSFSRLIAGIKLSDENKTDVLKLKRRELKSAGVKGRIL